MNKHLMFAKIWRILSSARNMHKAIHHYFSKCIMQVEIETVNRIIRNAKKPVMTIKPMAAGRATPFVGLNFSWATIRDCDMVTVGCFNEMEAAEDIEISRAALERRGVNLEGRSSPVQTQAAFGK